MEESSEEGTCQCKGQDGAGPARMGRKGRWVDEDEEDARMDEGNARKESAEDAVHGGRGDEEKTGNDIRKRIQERWGEEEGGIGGR